MQIVHCACKLKFFCVTIKMYEIDLNGFYQIWTLLAHNLKAVAEISMCVTVVMK